MRSRTSADHSSWFLIIISQFTSYCEKQHYYMVKESSWLYYLDHKYICLTCLTTLLQRYSHQGLPEVYWGPFQVLQGFTNYNLLQLAAALASAALAWYSANLYSSLRSAESYDLCTVERLWNESLVKLQVMKMLSTEFQQNFKVRPSRRKGKW